MKTTNRVRKNSATKPATSQAKIPASPEPEVLIPSQVAKDAETALLNLERAGNAAVAFVMMNAYAIKESDESFAECEELAVSGFGKCSLELARLVSTDFQTVFADLTRLSCTAIKIIQNVHEPVNKEPEDGDFLREVEPLDPGRSWYKIESKVGALANCINLQSWILGNSHEFGTQSGHFEIKDKLEMAIKAFDRVILDLLNSFCVVRAAARQ